VVIGGTKIIWSLLEPVKLIIDHVLQLHQAQYPVQQGSLGLLEDRALLVHLVPLARKAEKEIWGTREQKGVLGQLDLLEI